jgi:hypothetical protein
LAKEQFFYPATQPLFKKLEELSQRSSVSRGQAFEDWLTAMVCTLAAETMEGGYLAMVDRHTKGKMGERGVDLMARMFGELVEAMSCENADILGDLFQGAVTYGEAGQYFSPISVAQLLATITVDPDARPARDQPIYIHDPCCGTGRMLLEAAKVTPHAELVGQDIDARCTKITVLTHGRRQVGSQPSPSHWAGGNLGASNQGRLDGNISQTTMKPVMRKVAAMTIKLTAIRFVLDVVQRANVTGQQPALCFGQLAGPLRHRRSKDAV